MRRITEVVEELSTLSADVEFGEADDPMKSSPSAAIEAVTIVLVLIALTILFEKMEHAVVHHAGHALRPIVETLFGELTVLGFLSTITYCLEQVGFFEELSKWISGETDEEEMERSEEEEDEVFELVEKIHFGMFFVMVVFLVSVLCEVRHGLQAQKEWCQWDRACQDKTYIKKLLKENHEIDDEFDAVSSMGGIRGTLKRAWRFLLPYLSFLPFLRDERKENLVDKMEFSSLRVEFYNERSEEPPFAPAEAGHKMFGDHFNFGRYLTFVFAKKMAHVVEIDTKTWIFFTGGAICYFFLFDALGFSLKTLAWAWVLIGWIFHVLSINFEKYLLGIRDRLMAPEFVPEPKRRILSWHKLSLSPKLNSKVNGTEKEPLRYATNDYQSQNMGGSDDLPIWCHINLDELDQRRSRLSKAIFGPTPQNRMHALYLFGSHGPEFHLLCLRIMLVFSCIYSAQLVIMFVPLLARDKNTTPLVFVVYCVLASVPALAFIFNKKRLIAALIQVGSVGPFVLPQAVADSEREEKTSMAVRVLVIYWQLARMTKQFLANPLSLELKSTNNHYTEILCEEETASMGRIYKLFFDQDGDGFVSGAEYCKIMSAVNITITEKEASELLLSIAKAVGDKDGELGLSMGGFFQWYANLSLTQKADDKKQCADFLFGVFDDDNSGDITVLEFKQKLDNMDIGISHEEANQLIEEMDEDGNGVLCRDEFQDMVDHFYPLEFENSET